MSAVEQADFCEQEVKRYDYDRWLTSLLAPAAERAALLAIYAFGSEVARTAEQVSQPMLGEIRLQWWRETIEGAFAGTPRKHPVAESLAALLASRPLARPLFERLLEQRARDLYEEPPETLGELEVYASATGGGLNQMALQALGLNDPATLQAGGEIGAAYALVGLLRAVPFHLAQQRLYLPRALLAQAGLTPEQVLQEDRLAALAPVAEPIASRAAALLRAARARRRDIARDALPVLVQGRIADVGLKALAKVKFRLDQPGLQPSKLARQAAVWRASLSRRF